MIRLVATDLDGTLWGPDQVIPALHGQAVHELGRRGVTVLLATSRRPRMVRPRIEEAGILLPAVLANGSLGIDFRNGQRFHEARFDPVDAVAVLAAFRGAGLDPCVYVEDPAVDLLVSERPSTCPAHLANLGRLWSVADLDRAVAALDVYAFMVLGLPRERLQVAADRLTALGTEVVLSPEPGYGGFGLYANPPGVSKWSGVEAFCRLAGIVPHEVLAVGDGENDLPMLARAGVAVAVAGGSPRALAAADHVIGPPSEHGWASLLELVR